MDIASAHHETSLKLLQTGNLPSICPIRRSRISRIFSASSKSLRATVSSWAFSRNPFQVRSQPVSHVSRLKLRCLDFRSSTNNGSSLKTLIHNGGFSGKDRLPQHPQPNRPLRAPTAQLVSQPAEVPCWERHLGRGHAGCFSGLFSAVAPLLSASLPLYLFFLSVSLFS